jgi:hypothetical protein
MQAVDGFHWNLNENKKFSGASMYRALIQHIEPVVNNKMILPLKTKVFCLVFSSRSYHH